MRLARFLQFRQQFQIPKSTTNQYNFDPKIVTLGQPKFSSSKTARRISNDEFINIRAKVLHKIQSRLCFIRALFYLRFITIFLSLAFCSFRVTVNYLQAYHILEMNIISSWVL